MTEQTQQEFHMKCTASLRSLCVLVHASTTLRGGVPQKLPFHCSPFLPFLAVLSYLLSHNNLGPWFAWEPAACAVRRVVRRPPGAHMNYGNNKQAQKWALNATVE